MLIHDSTAESEEFNAILTSALFAGETNSKRFLKFVCDKYFAGTPHVSEYEIAVEAFGRRADFDPAQDSIVRVEAHRVRKRLQEYYEQEGSMHTLRLVVPHGSYLPHFVAVSGAGAEYHGSGPSIGQEKQAPRRGPLAAVPLWSSGKFGILVLTLISVACLLAGLVVYVRSHVKTPASRQAVAAVPAPPIATTSTDVFIMAGAAAKAYTDQFGHDWTADRFYDGGQPWQVSYRRILRTSDPQLYLTARQGEDFGYNIPLQPGLYELRLYFAETYYGDDNSEGGGESSRMFDVIANGIPLLTDFDPLSDAGGSNTADVRVFAGISPAADGKLHLRFRNHWQLKGVAFVNAIQLSRTDSKQMLPIRWVASASAIEDQEGRLWLPDQYVQGGRRRELNQPVTNTNDPELYKSERYGNFSYAVPVISDASYTLTLYFAEHWFGAGDSGAPDSAGDVNTSYVGFRVFDVYCNGVYLLQDFDIYKEAGGSLKAISRTYHGLRPNHQGKLLLSFVPNRNYATLSALEIVEEAKK